MTLAGWLVYLIVRPSEYLDDVRERERARIHVRIAVAVAADPGADREEGREPGRAREAEALLQPRFQLLVQARQLGEEGHAEVRQAVVDLVAHLQAGEAQDGGEPQAQHLAPELRVARRVLRQREQARENYRKMKESRKKKKDLSKQWSEYQSLHPKEPQGAAPGLKAKDPK